MLWRRLLWSLVWSGSLPLIVPAQAGNPRGETEPGKGESAVVAGVPVLELAFARDDGDRPAAPPSVAVSIHADGTVLVPDPRGSSRPLRGRLSAADLQGLLNEVIETHGLFDCDTGTLAQSLQSAARQSGLAWRIPQADTTVIRVQREGRQHEVRCPAAELLEERFPGVEDLQRLCRVQRRLQNVRSVVLVGGPQEADRLAAMANQELRRRGVEGLEMTSSDLQQVLGSGDGFRLARFQRCGPRSPQEGETQWLVSIVETPDSPPRVSVTPLPTGPR